MPHIVRTPLRIPGAYPTHNQDHPVLAATPTVGALDAAAVADDVPESPTGEPLDFAIKEWHARLTTEGMLMLKDGLKGLAGKPLRVGTGFSGCDISYEVLKALSRFWHDSYNVSVPISLAFACECDLAKAAWLRAAHPECKAVFRDMAELCRAQAYNTVTGNFDLVPPVDLFLGGFVCTDKSRLNNKRAQHIQCVQNASAKTGGTFKMCFDFLKANRPHGFVLENVPEIANRKKGEKSDLEFIVEQLTEIGYDVSTHMYQATEHGSLAERTRCWIRGIAQPARGQVAYCHRLMRTLVIPVVPCELFFGRDFVLFDSINDSWENKGGCRKEDPAFRDEHIKIFRESRLSYPPTWETVDAALLRALRPLEIRAREAVMYAEQTEPWAEVGKPQFFDCNMSLGFLVGSKGDRRVFSETVPTIATSSKVWSRVQLRCGEKKWCLLNGAALMRLVGWPGEIPDGHDHRLMTGFAGNAFSAFSVGPILIGYVSVARNRFLKQSSG